MMEHLTWLAQDRAPARRAELLAAIIDLYRSAGERAEPTIRTLFAEIVSTLLPGLPDDAQATIAADLAGLQAMPHALLFDLVLRHGVAAETLLRHALLLSDDDLIVLAAQLPERSLLAIAGRVPLGERVTDALVAHGGAALCHAVIANRSARLSSKSLARIVAVCDAGSADELRPPAEVITFPPVAETPGVTSDGVRDRGRVLPFPRRETGRTPDAARLPAIASAIAVIASNDRMLEVAMLLAAHAGLPPDLVSRLIARPDPALLAVLCRAADVSTETFAVIARIRGQRFGHAPERIVAVEQAYAMLTATEARAALRNLKAEQQTA